MKCIEVLNKQLVLTKRETPSPGPDEVLIHVKASGVNRPDVLQRQGLYPPPAGASDIPGLEVAGYILETGKNVSQWQKGDEVCALITGGGYAEYAVAHKDLCLPIPESLTIEQAASLPECFFTVCYNLFILTQMQPGQKLLVHGGGSGIGTAAIQIAKAFGIKVFTTAGSDEKCRRCKQLGADVAINYRMQDFVEVIKQQTQGQGVEVILDMVGGDYIAKNIRAAAFRGRIIQLAFLNGSKVEVDFMPLMLKQISLTGATLRSRPITEKAVICQFLSKFIWPLLNKKKISPCIDQYFPLEQAALAHQTMEECQHFGKIVLLNNSSH